MENHPAHGPTCILKVSTCCLGGSGLWPPHFTKLWPPKFIKRKKVITCCKGCATKIKKKLQKMNGVNSITIDYEKGMVAVSGEMDPATILVTISKLKIMAELVSYKKDPRGAARKKNQPQQIKNPTKIGHHHRESNSKSDSTSDSDSDIDEGHDHAHKKISKHKKMNGPFVAPHGNGKGYFPKSSRPEFRPPPRGPYGSQNHWGSRTMFGRPPPGPPLALPLPQPTMPMPMPPPSAYGYDYHSNMVPLPRPPPPHMYPYHHRLKDPPVGNSMLHFFSDDNTSANSCTIM